MYFNIHINFSVYLYRFFLFFKMSKMLLILLRKTNEQNVADFASEDESANNPAVNSSHDSGIEIEEFEDSHDIPKSSEDDYFLSRHTQRNGLKVKWSKIPPTDIKTRSQNIIFHFPEVKQLFFDSDFIERLITNTK